jgi:hypothetical protein
MESKTYTFTTYNSTGDEVRTYNFTDYHISYVEKYARDIICNSKDGEVKKSRIKISK